MLRKEKKSLLCIHTFCNFVSRGINDLILNSPATLLGQTMFFSYVTCLSTSKKEFEFMPTIFIKI